MRSPRLNISLPPEVVRIVATIAGAQGVSQSSVVRDVLVEASPVLGRIAGYLENYRKLEKEKRDFVRQALAEAEHEAEKLSATAMALLDRIGAEQDPRRGAGGDAQRPPAPRRAPARRQVPPLANRGDENGSR